MHRWKALLEGDEELDAIRLREVRSEYNTLKIPYDSNKHHAWILDTQITRREQLLNHETLMADYTESMANWKADEQELNEKRESLSTRLEQIQQQAEEDLAKARQAETDAATAYAQSVAWGDTEGEKNANTDAQKAAKNLATAIEHNRRQHLIITALEQETGHRRPTHCRGAKRTPRHPNNGLVAGRKGTGRAVERKSSSTNGYRRQAVGYPTFAGWRSTQP